MRGRGGWRAGGLALALGLLMTVFASQDAQAAASLRAVSYDRLQGWRSDGQADALRAFQRSCRMILKTRRKFRNAPEVSGRREDWIAVCRDALQLREAVSDDDARRFFEERFVPVAVAAETGARGLFTGYFEPEIAGSRRRHGPYQVPLYARPHDLVRFNAAQRASTGLTYGRVVNGRAEPYPPRKEIEQGLLAGRNLEIVWVTSWADAFFMQVQGSGRVALDTGEVIRLSYAMKSGRDYTPIGLVLIERGEIAREDMSMQAIRAWMTLNPQAARELMWLNESFVFFREASLDDPALGPVGAQKVQLTPLRSLAIDYRYWAYGTPLWLETTVPEAGEDELQPFNRLMVAQDTGSAVRGLVRGDIFFGAGEAAAIAAGHMKSKGRYYALLPKELAARLKIGR